MVNINFHKTKKTLRKQLNYIKEININQHPVILFDGVCNLCNSAVQLVIQKDVKNIFKFSSLQSNFSQNYLNTYYPELLNTDSILLITATQVYTKSSAVLKITQHLKGLYPILAALFILPKPIRDFFYDLIAKNRYRWFGQEKKCWVATTDLKDKFL